MKNKSILILGVVALVVTLACPVIALAQTVAEQLVRIQTDPPAGQVTAFFEKTVTIEGVQYRQPWTSVSWSIGAQKTVTVGGKTYTYAEVLAAAAAIAAQERAEQLAAQAAPPANP